MDQIITGVSAQKSPFHSRADAATVADARTANQDVISAELHALEPQVEDLAQDLIHTAIRSIVEAVRLGAPSKHHEQLAVFHHVFERAEVDHVDKRIEEGTVRQFLFQQGLWISCRSWGDNSAHNRRRKCLVRRYNGFYGRFTRYPIF